MRYLPWTLLLVCTVAYAEMSPDVIDPGFTVYTLTEAASTQVIGMAVAVGSADLSNNGILTYLKNQTYWRWESPSNQSDLLNRLPQGPGQSIFCQASGTLGSLPSAGFRMYMVHTSTSSSAGLLYGCGASNAGTQAYVARAFNLSTPVSGPQQLSTSNLYKMEYVGTTPVAIGFLQWSGASPMNWYLTNSSGAHVTVRDVNQSNLANLKLGSSPLQSYLKFTPEGTAQNISNFYQVTDSTGLPVRR